MCPTGAQSIAMSLQEAADFMLTNLHVARYWRRKVTDRDYHAGSSVLCTMQCSLCGVSRVFSFWLSLCVDTWGGARTYRFSENDRFLLHFAVYSKTLETPTITALEVSQGDCKQLSPRCSTHVCQMQMLVYLRDELEFEVSVFASS